MGLSGTPITDVNAFTATVPKPAVGTPVEAGDVEAVAQALANRTTYLNDRRLQRLWQAGDDSVPGGVWGDVTYAGGLGGADGYVDVEDCEVGDILVAALDTSVTMNGGSNLGGAVRLVGIDDVAGVPNPAGQLLGSEKFVGPNGASPLPDSFYIPLTIAAVAWTVAKAGTTRIAVQGKVFDGADTLTPGPAYSILVHRYTAAVAT